MSPHQQTEAATRYVAASAVPDPRPWFTYERRSRIGKGAHITMDNQHAENVEHVRNVAGPDVPIRDFRDNASGWDESKRRPDWEAMLQALRDGEAAGVVGWHSDRLTRQPAQLEELISATKIGGAQLHTRLGGHHADPTMIRIEMALAAKESDVKSDRQKLHHAGLAAAGKPHGGRRAYGYTRLRDAVVPAEAAHVIWMAKQVLAGRSLRSIAADLAERGATNVAGNPWRASNIAVYLKNPMLTGLRVHHGEIVGEASWPAILDRATWEAVHAILSDPARRNSKRAPRVYLLTAIGRCGVCGGPLRGRSNASSGKPPAYFCEQRCVYRRSDLVDEQVRAMVVSRLAQVDVTGALQTAPDVTQRSVLEARRTELEANLDGLVAMAYRGEITQRMLATATKEATQEMAALETALRALSVEVAQPAAVLEGLAGKANAAQLFDALPLERRRAVVNLLCQVQVLPLPYRAAHRIYDPALVQVTWR